MFGAQRLAIRGIDDGVQPIVDPATGVMVVCNGEIDNHMALREDLALRGRLVRQATDVAVIPALYIEHGENFVEKLEGAFAIALWDPRTDTLILARDRAGERPLFYRWNYGLVIFATEVAALATGMADDLAIDRAAITGYLRSGCFAAPSSPCQAIRKLGPGECVVFSVSGVRKTRYWRWPVVETEKRPVRVDDFDEVFRAAIRRQSDVDVDYGVFLSGGLDSSLIAAVLHAVRPEHRPPCYTLRFAEASYDEGIYAERVAAQFGLKIAAVEVTPDMLITELPHMIGMAGEPLADPAWIPTAMLARRAAQDVRLVFGGEGGDELFGGYPTYPGASLACSYGALPVCARSVLGKIAAALPVSDRKMPLSYLLKRFVEVDGMTPLARHASWVAPINPNAMRALGIPKSLALVEPEGGVLLDHLQRHDLETTLAEGLLTKADRGGMSSSLEIRTPYLDRTVMEFAASLPVRDRVRRFETKVFLKKYAERYLPHDIIYRRKRGLSIPLGAWLRGPLRDWAMEKIASGRLAEAGLDSGAVENLFLAHLARQFDHAKALWALLVLDEWLIWHRVAAS